MISAPLSKKKTKPEKEIKHETQTKPDKIFNPSTNIIVNLSKSMEKLQKEIEVNKKLIEKNTNKDKINFEKLKEHEVEGGWDRSVEDYRKRHQA